ncbi:MAG: MFS transporter [Pseudomonadota bacterium]
MTPVFAIRLTFALNAIGLAVWFPRIPDVKALLDVDLMVLSFCFFMLPVGVILGFFSAPAILERYGPRRVCMVAGPLFILMFVPPALATTAVELAGALFLAGLTIASIEVAMNGKAVEIELTSKRRIMSSCHGFWSIGSMTGALLGGAAGAIGMTFLQQQLLLAPPLALAAYFIARMLPHDVPGAERAGPPRLTLPKGALLAVCIMPMGALMIEGAMMEWSALFLRGDLGAGPFWAGACFAAFSLSMALVRMSGDMLTMRLGPANVLIGSAIVTGIGIAVFALSPRVEVAFLAAMVVGAGAGNVYPLAMSRAAQVPGRSAEDNIAVVAFTAFSVFLLGPPLIGTLAHFLGLPIALLLLTPAGLYPLLLVNASLGAQPQGSTG